MTSIITYFDNHPIAFIAYFILSAAFLAEITVRFWRRWWG